MTEKVIHTDGVMVRETVFDTDGTAYGRLSQPSAGLILARNQELRKNPEAIRPLQSMGWALSIPEADYYNLRRLNPDLAAPCALTRTVAWKKFIASPESLPYRVRG